MVIVKLQGGLGNQMFQYAAAAGLNKGNVYLDTSFLKEHHCSTATFTARKFELGIFQNLKVSFAGGFVGQILYSRKIVYRLLKKIGLNTFTDGTDIKTKQGYKAVYLDGYFQNQDYFKHIRGHILNTFKFPVLAGDALAWSRKILADSNSVSVHVRRSDYLKPGINEFHGVLPISYYQDAKSIIEEKITDARYYIFSDDPAWCAENFSFMGNSVQIITNTTQNWEDMCLMNQCRHHIIANSSYSWWGAWLNNNNNKVVIAPEKWFVQQATEIVPSEWIRV